MWKKLGINKKIFILFFLIALIPLLSSNILWLRSSRIQLKSDAEKRISIMGENEAQRLDNALSSKINSVVTLSQQSGVIALNRESAENIILNYSKDDLEVHNIDLINKDGDQIVSVESRELKFDLENIKDQDIYTSVIQPENQAVLSDVYYIDDDPYIKISVPLINSGKLGDQNLTDIQSLVRRFGGDISGALSVEFNLTNIINSVLDNELGTNGYSYIVHSNGALVAHPDSSFRNQNKTLTDVSAVSTFASNPFASIIPSETISETGEEVLSTHQRVNKSGWGIIIQEPLKSIYAPVDQQIYFSLSLIAVVAVLATLLGLLFSRNLTNPIKQLVSGATKFGSGDLSSRIAVHSSDEIGALGQRFNEMADNLTKLISSLKIESTKLNVVMNSVKEGIVATDENYNIIISNVSAAVLAGALPGDLATKSFGEVFKLTKNNKPYSVAQDTHEVIREVIYIAPNKRLYYLDLFVSKITDDQNGIRNIITIRDQTESRDLEMMKLDFVSMAAHELRTPITAVRGYLGLVASDVATTLSNESKDFIHRALSSTKQLGGLINNLLNVSKIERGTLNMNFTKTDWVSLVKEVVEDNKFAANTKSISIEYQGETGGIYIAADGVAIREVLNNLVSNAVNYTPNEGKITIITKAKSGFINTTVKDTGVGIPANSVHKLFTKFYRVKGGLSSGSGGTGLGLYIAKSIVELHKGKIWVESEYGSGATFTFTLPLYDEKEYNDTNNQDNSGVKKSHGWITKNITR